MRVDCEHLPRTWMALQLDSKEVFSHLIRLTTSGEINSDCSIHLGRTHWDQFSVQHFFISTNQSTALQLHEIPWHQISRLQVPPLTVAILGALWYHILLQCLHRFLHQQAPYFENHSTLSGASSVRPHWMERQAGAHASHPAGLSQS